MFTRKLFFIALTAFLVACQPASGVLEVKDAWARPALSGGNGAAYFVIENGTGEADVLLSANAEIASAVELHMTMSYGGDTMEMQMQREVAIPRGKMEFKPGGLHVMFIGLTRELKVGDTFDITLNFRDAGEMKVAVTVREP